MSAGPLRSRVLIRRPGPGRDPNGQPIPGWVTVGRAWANIRHLTGSQAIAADVPASTVKASIKIRRRTDVTAAMQVVHGTTVYRIDAVLPDEEGMEFIYLTCETINA